MKAIEGINLSELVTEVDGEFIREKKMEVSAKIRGIVLNIHQWTAANVTLQRTMEKNTERLTKAKAKLTALQNGDWSVLKDDENQQNQQKQKGGAKHQDEPDEDD